MYLGNLPFEMTGEDIVNFLERNVRLILCGRRVEAWTHMRGQGGSRLS